MNSKPRVVLQLLTFTEPIEMLDRLFESLEKVEYPLDQWEIAILFNNPPVDKASHVKNIWLPKVGKTLPKISLIEESKNLGFAGGHQKMYEIISKDTHPEYIYLLNQDTVVTSNFLSQIIAHCDVHKNIAVAQSLIMLEKDHNKINGKGCAMHFLGFGFTIGHMETFENFHTDLPMFYSSGAGVLVRTKALEKMGGQLFDSQYFLYHEDLDLSWRARLAGYDIACVGESIIYHDYEFSKGSYKWYYIERNRHFTNLTHFKWGTWVFLLPPYIVMELGTLLFSIKGGWVKQKLQSWSFFLRPSTWKWIAERRRLIRSVRTVGDREILKYTTGIITNQEINNPLLTYIVNPCLALYHRFLKAVVRW